jgi:hypothetical protein
MTASRRRSAQKERPVSLLMMEVAQERLREREEKLRQARTVTRVRAFRRARRDAESRVVRLGRLPAR